MRAVPFLALILGTCPCKSVPASDATPPTAGLIVEYREPGGARVTRTVGPQDPDVTVNASKDDEIAVIYSGSDNEGLRIVKLEYDMRRNTGTSVIQPLLTPIEVSVSCPKDKLLGAHNFDPGGLPWRYEFTSRSDNWLGATTRTGKVTVRTQ